MRGWKLFSFLTGKMCNSVLVEEINLFHRQHRLIPPTNHTTNSQQVNCDIVTLFLPVYLRASWRSSPVSSVIRSLNSDTHWSPTSGHTPRRNRSSVHTVTTHLPSKVHPCSSGRLFTSSWPFQLENEKFWGCVWWFPGIGYLSDVSNFSDGTCLQNEAMSVQMGAFSTCYFYSIF